MFLLDILLFLNLIECDYLKNICIRNSWKFHYFKYDWNYLYKKVASIHKNLILKLS